MVLECISETSLHVFVKVVTENTALLPSTQSWDSFYNVRPHYKRSTFAHSTLSSLENCSELENQLLSFVLLDVIRKAHKFLSPQTEYNFNDAF